MTVVVIGGGIIGLAAAYYLRRRGVDVVVAEKSAIGTGSTGRANGGIRAQFTSPVSVELSKQSIAVWESFESEFGTDVEYRRPGYLFLARERETANRFRDNVRRQNELGVDSEFLTPAEAADLCPMLRAGRYTAAAYCADDGFADPHLGLQGFSTAVREAGAEIRTHTPVTDVRVDGGRVRGVQTADDVIDAEYVVNAAGAWAARVGSLAGVDLPISPRRRQLAVVEPDVPVPEDVPFTIDLDRCVHFRPERTGSAVVGGYFSAEDPEADPDQYDATMDVGWTVAALENAATMARYFGPDARIRRGWAGLYAVTPDHHPIIEETLPGLVTVAGFSGHGFMQSPAAGRIAAEMVVDGEATLVDVSDLTSDRFERGDTLEEGTVID